LAGLQLRWVLSVKWLWVALLGVVLAGCSATLDQSSLLEDGVGQKTSSAPMGNKQARLEKYIATHQPQSSNGNFDGFSQIGSDRLTGQPLSSRVDETDPGEADIQLNLLDVPLAAAARSVLGDVLELNYSIDSRVQGNITVQTSKPVTKGQLLSMFQGGLRNIGAALVGDGQNYRIIPLAEAAKANVALQTPGLDSGNIGQHPEIVPLRYVSADEIKTVLDPLVPDGMIVTADATRNALVLSGTSAEIAAVKETISVFDIDWMKGMSFALVPVRSSQPDAIVSDLENIYDTKKGPLRNIVRFVPNRRLKAVLIISSRAKYLQEAKRWIRKLDVLASSNEEGLHVYHVQNRTAAELAKVLQSVLKSETATASTDTGQVAPKLESEQVTAPQVDANGDPIAGPETPLTGLGSTNDTSGQQVQQASAPGIRIVSDDANNSLLIFSTDDAYKRILAVLDEVDSQANQVLLEAVIAEVTLDDDMKFGVRWLLGGGKESGTFSDIASGAIASSFPGFSYFLRANDISFTLNALASVTDVRVLSSPSLVVLDNKTATLQVGDQVPIVTQTAQGVQNGNAPIVNNVELKDTGVILNVTPRVNDSGRVILDVQQEVSSVVKTNTSGIDSPTIRQRKIKTSVVVQDGEALALGGLIQEKETTGKSKVPVLGDIPLLGNAFRQKSNAIGRTELIIFIRPRVIRDMDEARRITSEFRKEIGVKAPRVRRGETTPQEELLRILQ
jgi:general secretion pathway protein D